ncbi:MAG: FN3 associated domain-containing protein [Bacteroides sp.]|nr:FN3 associated domain-containing protein [Bacteroides sp.]
MNIIRKASLCAALLFSLSMQASERTLIADAGIKDSTAQTTCVVGTTLNTAPTLPATVNWDGKEVPVSWQKVDSSTFNTLYANTVVKGTVVIEGKSTEVEASVWTLPENLVYLIDAGTLSSDHSPIYQAARSLCGDALLNDVPDQVSTSTTSGWGHEQTTVGDGKRVHIDQGDSKDWATSFLSKTRNTHQPLAYRFTLPAGTYRITAAYVPCLTLTYNSWLRVDNARKSSKSVKTVATDDKRHPAVFSTYNLSLRNSTTFTFETDKLTGEEWENVSISLIAVERIGSNLPIPQFSSTSGDYWDGLQLSLTHKDASATIRYTTDGSRPTINSPIYTSPLNINHTCRVNAVACLNGDISPVATSDYVLTTWAVAATPFKLQGQTSVSNVKLNWAIRTNAASYRIYRNQKLIGTTIGDTFDDYDLVTPATYTYHVEALDAQGKVFSTSVSHEVRTFKPTGIPAVYDNLIGQYVDSNRVYTPTPMKIKGRYYTYRISQIEKDVDGQIQKGWQVTESQSATGASGSWSTPRELAFYPGVKFEGNAFRYNPLTGKVVLSSHYEDQKGYTAAKIYLAQITPGGDIEVGTMARPLGHDSRDQSVFVDDDNTAYLLSATRTNNDINIYRLDSTWTRPVALVNTVFIGCHRETPTIVRHQDTYYFFSSKASGWYPSQAMYASATRLDGVWSSLREIGNSSTFDAQVNNVQRRGLVDKPTFGLWSYHWGAQRKYKTVAGNFPRISIISFNAGFASADYYRYIEFYDDLGMVPVQAGRNLSLLASVTESVGNASGVSPLCITDGADMASSPYFQGSSYPYSLTVDLNKPCQLSEVCLSTRLVNGSEAAYKFTLEGSIDGISYQTIYDGSDNWAVGFLILPLEQMQVFRYLRVNVQRVVNVHSGSAANWAEGLYEIAVYGMPVDK